MVVMTSPIQTAAEKAVQILSKVKPRDGSTQRQAITKEFLSFLLTDEDIKIFLQQTPSCRTLVIEKCREFVSVPGLCSNLVSMSLRTLELCEEIEMEDLLHQEVLE